MVGIFSRFSGGRAGGAGGDAGTGYRRTQSSYEERATIRPSNTEADDDQEANNTVIHSGGVSEFKPVEHPVEPFDSDNPVQCPLPEPSILNDGRMWKERVTVESVRRGRTTDQTSDLIKEEEEEEGRTTADIGVDSEIARSSNSSNYRSKPGKRPQANRMMMPSLSAPERHLMNLLQENQ